MCCMCHMYSPPRPTIYKPSHLRRRTQSLYTSRVCSGSVIITIPSLNRRKIYLLLSPFPALYNWSVVRLVLLTASWSYALSRECTLPPSTSEPWPPFRSKARQCESCSIQELPIRSLIPDTRRSSKMNCEVILSQSSLGYLMAATRLMAVD